MVEIYGGERMVVDTSGDWGPSAPTNIPNFIMAMRRRGHVFFHVRGRLEPSGAGSRVRARVRFAPQAWVWWLLIFHALFVAFAPLEQPRIAVAVIVENGGGSSAAYPIARTVIDTWLKQGAG